MGDSHPGTGGWRTAPELYTHTHTHAHTRTHHPRPRARRRAVRAVRRRPLPCFPRDLGAAHARARWPRTPNHPHSAATRAPAAEAKGSHGPRARSPALSAPIEPMPPQLEPIAAREGRGCRADL
ncbi:unnamed protein product [Rangifer tarandus platyrhynchus]|uniref:Uncharacterized protein n=2 Tax=Rangifer tarandus platyrhynchus TaxID=3082113 RepID=A0ABN8YKH8_RANTA|nr:unnamed protein product [Rangifer tarandus platyrhynchus]CAI9160229.1 unnamed protein product [Rangifer tarandus platyrhynchus]CAI9699409.1 unnamed protein product [Rangifer tarandus platyrhynchus]